MISLKKITETDYDGDDGTTSNLNVKLTARDEKAVAETGHILVLDTEYDKKLEVATQFDFDASLRAAEKCVTKGRHELAERTYVETWQRVSGETRNQVSSVWEERKMKSILAYSKFLMTHKREYEASSILSSFWRDTQQSNTAISSQSSASYFHGIAKMMKTVGLATMALSIFKGCSEYYRNANYIQSSSYKEIQHSIQSTSTEVMQSVNYSSSVVSESTLEEMIYEASRSISTVDQTSFSTTEGLVQLYVSQHRWRDATRLIKRVLQGIWPTLFAASLEDVSLPSKHLESCVTLAERLCQCYHSRRRSTKEQDIRVRIYRSFRSGRDVEDKLRQHAITELLRFFETKSQTGLVINVHQVLLVLKQSIYLRLFEVGEMQPNLLFCSFIYF